MKLQQNCAWLPCGMEDQLYSLVMIHLVSDEVCWDCCYSFHFTYAWYMRGNCITVGGIDSCVSFFGIFWCRHTTWNWQLMPTSGCSRPGTHQTGGTPVWMALRIRRRVQLSRCGCLGGWGAPCGC